MITVKNFSIAPLKSGSLYHPVEVRFIGNYIEGDRVLMLVDKNGKMINQGMKASLCLVKTVIEMDIVCVMFPNGCELEIPLLEPGPDVDVNMHNQTFKAMELERKYAKAFESFLHMPCRLVTVSTTCPRKKLSKALNRELAMNFADRFGTTIISKATLTYFSQKMGRDYPSDRFRSTILCEGCTLPRQENTWKRILVGGIEFIAEKDVDRCVIPGINQTTAERDKHFIGNMGKLYRPDKTLARLFTNLVPGTISVGAEIQVLQYV